MSRSWSGSEDELVSNGEIEVKGEYGSASANANGRMNLCEPDEDEADGGGWCSVDGVCEFADDDDAAEREMDRGSAVGRRDDGGFGSSRSMLGSMPPLPF